ncbi:MAG: FAD-dependent monooxygenase [Polyangiaceae bacterium]
MRKLHVLVSGAGIAGPALAFWLVRRGVRCTLVERAATLRSGGQAVDFRGPVHRAVLERMELWDAIHERRTKPADLVILDERGRATATLPPVVIGGDVEILRGDLSELLFERVRSDVEARFGDSIASLSEDALGVDVRFESGARDRFDLVVAADGLRSRTRSMAFPEPPEVAHHGHRCVGFGHANALGLEGETLLWSAPGRSALVSDTGALFVFTGRPIARGEEPRALTRARYGADRWEVPRLLDALDAAEDVYFDAIGSVRAPRWSSGRIALLGDAAWGGTLGGQGTSLAIIGAYVLAGELARAGGVHTAAFAAYESRMRPFATRCQRGAERAGGFLAPRTSLGLRARSAFYGAMASPRMVGFFERLVKSSAADFDLPDYADVALAPRRERSKGSRDAELQVCAQP